VTDIVLFSIQPREISKLFEPGRSESNQSSVVGRSASARMLAKRKRSRDVPSRKVWPRRRSWRRRNRESCGKRNRRQQCCSGHSPMGTVKYSRWSSVSPRTISSVAGNCPGRKHPSLDLPSANGKYFVQLGGIGLDAQAVKETTLAFKRSLGPLSYLISAAHIAARQPPQLLIESEDAPVREGSFVLVGNGRLYGGPFHFQAGCCR